MHNHNMLEVNNLSKNFAGTGRETEFAAVDGISFTLDAGECLGPVSYTHLTLPTKLEV